MKKSSVLSLAFVTASIVLICWTCIVIVGVNGAFSSTPPSWPSSNPSLQGVTKNGGYYNISLAFTNVTYPERLDNILINPNSPGNVAGLTAYLNGTASNIPNVSESCNLKKGDSLQVNLVFPCSNFTSGSEVYLAVMGDYFGCGGYVLLP